MSSSWGKKGVKLILLSTGVEARLIASTRSTFEILKKHGFQPALQESPGAHSWFNWRNYLVGFAPQLFRFAASASATSPCR